MRFLNKKTGRFLDVQMAIISDALLRSDEYIAIQDSEHWITMNGEHILINGEGKVIAGAGDKMNGKTLANVGSKSKDVEKHGAPAPQFPQKPTEGAKSEPNTPEPPPEPPAPPPEPPKSAEPEKPKTIKESYEENRIKFEEQSQKARDLSKTAMESNTKQAHEEAMTAHETAWQNWKKWNNKEKMREHGLAYHEHKKQQKALEKAENKLKPKDTNLKAIESRYEKQSYEEIRHELASKFNLIVENGMGDSKMAAQKWKEYYELKKQGQNEKAAEVYQEYQKHKESNPALGRKQYNLDSKGASAKNMRKILGHVDEAFTDMQNRGFDIKGAMAKGKVAFAPVPASTRSLGTAWQRNGVGYVAINPTLLKADVIAETARRQKARADRGEAYWTVDGRTGDPLRSTIVHEMTHALGMQANIDSPGKLSQTLSKLLNEGKLKGGDKPIPENLTGNAAVKHWVRFNLSEYATTNIKETDAELCAYVTSKNYVEGTLPKELEDHVYELFGKK